MSRVYVQDDSPNSWNIAQDWQRRITMTSFGTIVENRKYEYMVVPEFYTKIFPVCTFAPSNTYYERGIISLLNKLHNEVVKLRDVLRPRKSFIPTGVDEIYARYPSNNDSDESQDVSVESRDVSINISIVLEEIDSVNSMLCEYLCPTYYNFDSLIQVIKGIIDKNIYEQNIIRSLAKSLNLVEKFSELYEDFTNKTGYIVNLSSGSSRKYIITSMSQSSIFKHIPTRRVTHLSHHSLSILRSYSIA